MRWRCAGAGSSIRRARRCGQRSSPEVSTSRRARGRGPACGADPLMLDRSPGRAGPAKEIVDKVRAAGVGVWRARAGLGPYYALPCTRPSAQEARRAIRAGQRPERPLLLQVEVASRAAPHARRRASAGRVGVGGSGRRDVDRDRRAGPVYEPHRAVGGAAGRPATGASHDGTRSVSDVLDDHVVFEVESIDRMYLNVWQPRLAYGGGVQGFFVAHRGYHYASTALMDPMTKAFVADIHGFVAARGLELVSFAKGQRKDDLAQEFLARFPEPEGVLFVGRAQEKAGVWRTQRRYNPVTGGSYAWLVRSSAFINFFYFYCVDADFGPFFIKFSTYFPYTAKLCLL